MKNKFFLILISIIPFTTISYPLNKVEKVIVLKEAKKHLGTKYVYGSKIGDINSFDCSSFMLYLYRQIDINLPRTSMQQSKKGVKVENLEVGDLLFFENKNRISHVGMYIGNNKFIHASSKANKVIISKFEGYYKRKFVFAKRY